MKATVILAIVVSLIIGTVGGYGTGYLIYVPKIKSLEMQVSQLKAEVSGLKQTVANQELLVSNLKSQNNKLQTDLSQAKAETQVYQQQAANLTSQLADSQKRLSDILGMGVTQGYQWTYQGRTWDWVLPISLSLYVEYRDKPRPQSAVYWVNMAKDPGDDTYIDRIVRRINEAALQEGFSEVQKLNFVIAFVQSLPYTVDKETTPYDEYPRYPVETLFDRGGDCEDTSILVAALLDRLGYDIALLLLRNAQHMAVGVSLPGTYGSYYEYGGKEYYYLETTGDGWQMGEIPPSITDTRASIYPLRS